jgi:hypothetical protein
MMSKRKRFSARRSAALYGIVYEASMQMRIEVLRGRAPIFTHGIIDLNKLESWIEGHMKIVAARVADEYERSYAPAKDER